MLCDIMSDFISREHVRDCNPFAIDVHNIRPRVPIKYVYIGIHVTEILTKFPNLTKVIAFALFLAHSTASVERLFSYLRRIKTDIKSRLKRTSMVSLLHNKIGLNRKGISSY